MTPDSKVHGANMGPNWVLSAPDGPHVGLMNLAIGYSFKIMPIHIFIQRPVCRCGFNNPVFIATAANGNFCHIMEWKCHFDEFFVTGCTGSCHFDNFQCNQWWKFHQNDIFVSVYIESSLILQHDSLYFLLYMLNLSYQDPNAMYETPFKTSVGKCDADQRKHQSSASLAFVRGIHRWPVNSPHKWPVTRKMFPFDDVIV